MRKWFDSLPPLERASRLALEQRRNEALVLFESGDHEAAERHFFGEPAKAETSSADAAHKNNGHARSESSEASVPACTVVSNMGLEPNAVPAPKPEPVRTDNLNEGFPGAKLPPLPSGARGESNAQKADFNDFKGLTEGRAETNPIPPPNAQVAAALNFGFPSELLHSSTQSAKGASVK